MRAVASLWQASVQLLAQNRAKGNQKHHKTLLSAKTL